MSETTVVLFVVVWVVFNLALHGAMRKVGIEPRLRWMLGALLWVAPFIGGLFAGIEVLKRRQAQAASQPVATVPGQAVAPLAIAVSEALPFPVRDHVTKAHGVPLLDWQAVDAWAASHADEATQQLARSAAHRAWLLHLRDALGDGFSVLETDACWLLSALPAAQAKATADYVAVARRRIGQVLQPLAASSPGSRVMVVAFTTQADYYEYVSLYYPDDGEFAFSGGMFIGGPCPHFVMVEDDLHAIEPVIVHELTHNALSALHLPLWLDEGIAVSTERRVAGQRWVQPSPAEMQAKHLAYWTADALQASWQGTAFQRVDDGNSLSYDLAHRLVQQLSRDWERFVAFVESVDNADHGDGALQTHYGFDLGAAAAAVLGLEPQAGWAPAARPH
jgi:hypothetical protein